jgi:hypothetical protein
MPDDPDDLRDLDDRLWGLTISADARVIKAAQPAGGTDGTATDG